MITSSLTSPGQSGYNDPAGGIFSQMRLHLAREGRARRGARVFSTLANGRPTWLFMNTSRRLIKRAHNCEHASNVAREPDDRDIGTSFYAPRSSRGRRIPSRWKFTVDASRKSPRRGNNEKLVLFNDEQFVPYIRSLREDTRFCPGVHKLRVYL